MGLQHIKKSIYLATYLPFVGWMIPMAGRQKDVIKETHGRHAFIAAVSVVVIQFFLYGAAVLIPHHGKPVKLGIIILIYVIYALYGMVSLYGTYLLYTNRSISLPLVTRFAGQLDI